MKTTTGKQYRQTAARILLVAALLGFGATAHAQSYRYGQVRDKLFLAAVYLLNRGFVLTHQPIIDVIDPAVQGYYDIALRFERGVQYGLVGVGDQYTGVVNFVLYDEQGHALVADTRRSDVAMVTFVPYYSGRYRLRLWIPVCRAPQCVFGVAAFGQ